MDKTMILKPRISEKAYALSQLRNVYVFVVPAGSSKQSIASAVETQYAVHVEEVNVMNVKGKAKRSYRKNGRTTVGKDKDVRKAYVCLKAGDSIPVFATEDEQEKPAKKEKK